MRKSAVVFAQYEVGLRCLRSLLARDVHVSLVITNNSDDASEPSWNAAIENECMQYGISHMVHQHTQTEEILSKVSELAPDFIFTLYSQDEIAWDIHRLGRCGAFSIQEPHLPGYRGKTPINWAVLHGEKETTVALYEIAEETSSRSIITKTTIPIFENETGSDVFQKLSVCAEQMLWNALPSILKGSYLKQPDDISKPSLDDIFEAKDGSINWSRTAKEVYNFHRAVAPPCQGAWTMVGDRKFTIGRARLSAAVRLNMPLGLAVHDDTILGTCGDGQSIIIHELLENGKPVSPPTLSKLLQPPSSHKPTTNGFSTLTKTVFILGMNGFIGHHLYQRILITTDWKIYGIDIDSHRIAKLLDSPKAQARTVFKEGSIEDNWDWIEACIRECDVILPLAAISTPASYVKTPLRIFELDFETNLRIIRTTVKENKRIIFPSTSEVYGMCHDKEFDPEHSELICGPIHKSRWMYSCVKQLLDRIMFAYGQRNELDFTIFRPFNWIGTGLDNIDDTSPGVSRVTSQFVAHITRGQSIQLVDGGSQQRTFTDIDDGIDALMKIIVNKNNKASGKIYNIGTPSNNCTIRELATLMVDTAKGIDRFAEMGAKVQVEDCDAEVYYGEGYQDIQHRVPNIVQTERDLEWRPCVSLERAIYKLFEEVLQDN